MVKTQRLEDVGQFIEFYCLDGNRPCKRLLCTPYGTRASSAVSSQFGRIGSRHGRPPPSDGFQSQMGRGRVFKFSHSLLCQSHFSEKCLITLPLTN